MLHKWFFDILILALSVVKKLWVVFDGLFSHGGQWSWSFPGFVSIPTNPASSIAKWTTAPQELFLKFDWILLSLNTDVSFSLQSVNDEKGTIANDHIRTLCTMERRVFRSYIAAFWQRIKAGRREVPMESLWHLRSESTKEIDLMSTKIVLGIWRCRGRISLAQFLKPPIGKWCLFSHACPCSQQSLSSQQLFQWGR